MSTKKKKKKGIDPSLIAPFPFLPGMMEPIQGLDPVQVVPNRNLDVPFMVDIRHLPTVPTGHPPPFVVRWVKEVDWLEMIIGQRARDWVYERYTKSIFYADDPEDLQRGLALAGGLSAIGGALWLYPPTRPAGLIILGIPDIFVAIPVGIAASNIYQDLEGKTPSDKAFRFGLPKSIKGMPFG